jgi:hypothetical protein
MEALSRLKKLPAKNPLSLLLSRLSVGCLQSYAVGCTLALSATPDIFITDIGADGKACGPCLIYPSSSRAFYATTALTLRARFNKACEFAGKFARTG